MTPQTILGFHIYWLARDETKEQIMYQTRILYDTWEDALKAGEAVATKEANEYCTILNKIDDMSFADCLSFKNTKLFILVDKREPNDQFGAVWATPVFKWKAKH